MSDSVGAISMDLGVNYGGFTSQIAGISSKAQNITSGMFMGIGMIATQGVIKIIKGLSNVASAGIALASDLDEVQNVVDVTFGNMASEINTFAKSAITDFGLSELSAKTYASTMGAMLKSSGLASQATEMSKTLTGLTGDLASFYNLDSETAFAKIRSGISGETEPLKQLGINLSVANLEAFALEEGITKSYESMSEAEKVMLRYNFILDKTADAQGDFVRTSDSWANQTRILSENISTLKATLGQGLINILTPAIQVLNNIISKLQVAATYFKVFTEVMSGASADDVSSSMEGMSESLASVTDSVENTSDSISGSLASFDELNVIGDSASSSLGNISSSLDGLDLGITSNETDTSMTDSMEDDMQEFANKIAEFMAPAKDEIIAAKEAVTELDTAIEELTESDGFGDLGEKIKEIFGDWLVMRLGTLAGEMKLITAGFQLFNAVINGDWSNLEWLETTLDAISKLVLPLIQFFTPDEVDEELEETEEKFDTAWENIRENMITYNDPTKLEFADFIDYFKDKAKEKLLDILPDSFLETFENIRANIATKIEEIKTGLSNAWDYISSETYRFLEPFKTYFGDIFGAIKKSAVSWVYEMTSNVSKFFSNIKKLVIFQANAIRNGLSNIWENLGLDMGESFDGMKDTAIDVLNGILSALNWFADKWNGIEISLPDIKSPISGNVIAEGFSVAVPQLPTFGEIPKFANGGLVSAPTLAMVGDNRGASSDPEVISPLSKLEGMLNTGISSDEIVALLKQILALMESADLSIYVGDTEFGKVASRAINKYSNKLGKSAIIV
jgi:hypothetical protein